MDPIKAVAGAMWPGVPLVPTMSTGATDAIYFGRTPVYGLSGIFAQPGETHAHGLDERIQVKSLSSGQALRERRVIVLIIRLRRAPYLSGDPTRENHPHSPTQSAK
ncbi:Probable peptidase [Mycobacteroides abscessus subsp. abscessus]|nr:Probable peptidase [Mycobacteroides abscessus subsp. abscessus]